METSLCARLFEAARALHWLGHNDTSTALTLLGRLCSLLEIEDTIELERYVQKRESCEGRGETYPPDWKQVNLMVSPTGEIHAIGGDRVGNGDTAYLGLEVIKKCWSKNSQRENSV